MIVSAIAVFAPKAYAVGSLDVENAAIGGNNFFYTADTTNVGDTFVINITVHDITDLATWQISFGWDPTQLEYVSASRPSDDVFADAVAHGRTPVPVGPIVDTVAGNLQYGCTYIGDPWTFNGTGRCAQLTFRIIQAVDELNPSISSDLTLLAVGVDTFLLDRNLANIPFTGVNGHFSYTYIPPPYYPTLLIKPSVVKPDKINDVFALDIMVKDVHAGWSIIGFQFSLMWNTTFIEPAAPYFDNGTFLEGFQYYADGVFYVADINTHNRPPPLTPIDPAYNYSMFAALLLPDGDPNPPYHAPFPSTTGTEEVKLMTVYFKAIYETISPVEDWTWIEFITFDVDEDTYAVNKYLHVVQCNSVDAHYRAPMKVLGLSIDLYTQYPSPYGGQGGNQTSDMFGPQALVDLFALVTYNEYPVQQKLVGFQVFHEGATQTYNIYREGTTDINGIAHVSFRLPWPCADPVNEIFGWWYVNATVEVAEQIVVDNLKFFVYWPVFIISIEPNATEFVQRKTGGDDLIFKVTYGTYSMQTLPATITATIYDELSFFIGSDFLVTTVGWGEYGHEAELKSYEWTTTMPLPTNAVVGKGTAYGNAFTDFPWNGGVPYCPEVTNTIDFYIKKP